MNKSSLQLIAVAGALSLLSFDAKAAETSGEFKKVMPDAMAALERMGEHLKTLKQFTLQATATNEDVLDYGEKITIGGEITYHVKSPDRLRLDLTTDKRTRQYFYNGTTVTVYAPKLKVYAVVAAPDTTAKMIEDVEDKYGVEVPLADLFYLGTKESAINAGNIRSAFYVSDALIDGSVCAHYAYRTGVVNYQVWIHQEGEPLPCKVVRDNVRDPARPQYSAILTWKTDDVFAEDVFNFTPPADVEKIEMVPSKATPGRKQ